MSSNVLNNLSKELAVDVIKLCEQIDLKQWKVVLVNQLVASATSVGANIREANYAASNADFINKLQISLKECYETEYWLELFSECGISDAEIISIINGKAGRIRKMLISAITKSKQNP